MITNRDYSWYSLAAKVARDSSCNDKHGAVIVRSGVVLAIATNRTVCSHPVSEKYLKKTLHAEQRALIRIGSRLAKGSTLYSARLHKYPTSKPCEMCEELILESGVKYVVYNDGQKLVKVRVKLH